MPRRMSTNSTLDTKEEKLPDPKSIFPEMELSAYEAPQEPEELPSFIDMMQVQRKAKKLEEKKEPYIPLESKQTDENK